MVSVLGWLNGITALCVVIFAIFFGLLSFYHARKLKANLLAFTGITIIFVGLIYIAPVVDFMSLLLIGNNIEPIQLYGLISYMWVAPGMFTVMYLGIELLIPKRKLIIIAIYAILGIVFELFLWFDIANIFTFEIINPGDIIDATFNRGHPTFILMVIFLMSILFFEGFGFSIKAIQSTGEIRKKFAFLAIGFITFVLCGVFDSLLPPGIGIVFVRMGMIAFILLTYQGLKT